MKLYQISYKGYVLYSLNEHKNINFIYNFLKESLLDGKRKQQLFKLKVKIKLQRTNLIKISKY